MYSLPNKIEFTELYLNYTDIFDVAEKYKVSDQTIFNWAKRLGISRKVAAPTKDTIKALIKENLTQKETSIKAKCSIPTLKKYIELYKLEAHYINIKKIDIDELYRLRVECKWTYRELAELYQVADTTLRTRCKEFDFPKVKVERICSWKLASN